MAIRLTSASREARNSNAVSPYFDIQISGNDGVWFSVDKNDIMPDYRYGYDMSFGVSSFSFILRNPLSGNSPRLPKYHPDNMNFKWNSAVRLYEGYKTKGSVETIQKFQGLIRQINQKEFGGGDVMEITAYDNMIRLKETDLDKTYEANKIKVTEILTPNLSQVNANVIGVLSGVSAKPHQYTVQFGNADVYSGVFQNINKTGVAYLPEQDKYFKFDYFNRNDTTNELLFSGVRWGVINNDTVAPATDTKYRFKFFRPVSYIFDGTKQNWADSPAPILQWDLYDTNALDSTTDGFEVNYEGGQVITPPTEAVRILDFYLSGTYYYYPSGNLVEDIIKDIMTQGQIITSNELTTDYFAANGNPDNTTPLDTLTMVETVYTSSENTKLDEMILRKDVLSGANYTVRGVDLSDFDSSGYFNIGGEIFSYAGITNNDFTGVVRALSGSSAKKHKRFDIIRQAYESGEVFLFDYDNITDSISVSDFSGVTAVPDVAKVSTRYGRMILSSPDLNGNTIIYSGSSAGGWGISSGNYNFTTIQATGVEISNFRVDPVKYKYRLDAIDALRKVIAPNYIIHSKGDGKIWGEYLNQKTSADYSIDLETSSMSFEDSDVYTRVVVYGRPSRPKDILKDRSEWGLVPPTLQTGRVIKGELKKVLGFESKKSFDYELYAPDGAGVFQGVLDNNINANSLTMTVKSENYKMREYQGDTIYIKENKDGVRKSEIITFKNMVSQVDGTFLLTGLVREAGNKQSFSNGADVFTMPKINILPQPKPQIFIDDVPIRGGSVKVTQQPMLIKTKKETLITYEV